ncbi:MAG: carboxypeptidase regulatory-like domain-containing protein [Acidobacteriota bacterium]|nr:carboxypeptidase regulatory-like domain-containing protein [Acidobacteriota bacterium]
MAYPTVTNSAGNYVLQQLAVGNYEVAIDAKGFRRYVHSAFRLEVAQTVTLDAKLELGEVEQTMSVSSDVSTLQTSTSDLGATIDRSKLLQLPLYVSGKPRDLEQFTLITPGVTGDTTNTQISGSPSRGKEVLVDGIASTGIESGGTIPGSARPSVETIGEFRLLRANFNAEYGRTGGGIEIFSTRSGTNSPHGAAFDILRNDALDARGFFLPKVAVNRQNEYGFSMGGPVVIPKLYDGRNKTFFFFVYGGYRYRQGAPNTLASLVPSDFRNGDFSRSSTVIYDPATNQISPSGAITRSPFPNNQIPPNRFSAVSKNVLAVLPAPVNNGVFNNYISTGRGYTDEDQYDIKMDHSIGQRHRLSGFYYRDLLTQNDPTGAGADRVAIAGPATESSLTGSHNHWVRLSEDFVISPTVVNHVGLGFTRFLTKIDSASLNQDWPQKLGLTGVNTGANNSFPCIDLSSGGYNRIGQPNCNARTLQTNNAFQADESLSTVRGSHNLKFGFEYRFMETNGIDNFQAPGFFQFNALETGLPNVPRTGNAAASFLLGAVDTGTYKLFAYYPRNRYQYIAGYAQDDWKITPKLTVNYGLRYEIFFPRSEKLNNLSAFDPSVPNPGAGGRLGALTFLGSGPGRDGRKSFADTYYKSFGPRIGVAYQVMSRTVLRAGYGIYYAAGNANAGLRDSLSETYGFSASPVFTTTNQGASPAFYWDGGFPQNYPKPPFIDPTAANNTNVRTILRGDGPPPYIQNWSFTVQRELAWRVSLEVSYLGTKGTRLGNGLIHLNELDPSYLALGSLLSQPFNSAQAVAAGIAAPFPGFTGSVAQALRPYPQYLDIWDRANPAGDSTYHSFQSQLTVRAARGLDLQLSYTFAKTISDTDVLAGGGPTGQTAYNRKLEKAIADTDVPNVFAVAYSYQLPFGPGQKLLNNTNITGRVLGGWILTGIQQYSSGLPIVLTVNNTLPLFTQALRPNAVPGVTRQLGGGKFDPAAQLWINPAAFTVPAPLHFGTSARSYEDLRFPNFYNESFGLMKRVALRERFAITLRGEFFNIFNRTVFGGPPANASNANFGRITSQSNNPRQGQVSLRLEF